MKVTVKGKQYNLVTIVAIDIIDEKSLLKTSKLVAVAYVYDKERNPYKFLADEIERYD
jgi:hypothetical protein